MAAPSYMARANAAAVRVHGEPVTLADASELTAIFEPGTEPGWAYGAGVQEALDTMAQPALQVLDADAAVQAAQLAGGQIVTVRGSQYVIAEPGKRDEQGLTRYPLAPAQDQDDDPAAEAWRWR